MPYFGNDWAAYTNRMQPKSAVTTADASRFMDFVKCVNLADDERFQAAVRDFMDVDEFLRFLALQALLANLDSPLLTGHNYYLWLPPKTRKFLWLPWDLNEAFGGFNPAGSLSEQMDLSMDHPFTRVNRLAERLLETPGVKDRYHEIVRGLLATNFNATRLFPLVDAMAATIRPALAEDRMVSQPQFEAALSATNTPVMVSANNAGEFGARRSGPGGAGRPRTPLKVFITQRGDSIRLQLDGKSSGYLPREIRPGPNGGPQPAGPPREPPRW